MTRKRFAVALPIVAALPLIAAYAGGWATITVEDLPDYIVAGQPTNITFSVRQHGMKLLEQLSPAIEAHSGDSQVNARAVETNRPGYYTATLNVPKRGDWALTVRSGFMNSEVRLLPIPAVASGAIPAVLADADRGRRLFVAKGCVTCHVHSSVPESGRIAVGPDLTLRRLPSSYLQKFLANPAIKQNWSTDNRMPNLNLKPAEISALVAFINNEKQTREASAGN